MTNQLGGLTPTAQAQTKITRQQFMAKSRIKSVEIKTIQWLESLDPGISRAVKILQENGIETFESCEGGFGHPYPEPTIRFHGTPEAGWRALSVCLAHGLRAAELRRVWDILETNEPTGPHWEIIFRR